MPDARVEGQAPLAEGEQSVQDAVERFYRVILEQIANTDDTRQLRERVEVGPQCGGCRAEVGVRDDRDQVRPIAVIGPARLVERVAPCGAGLDEHHAGHRASSAVDVGGKHGAVQVRAHEPRVVVPRRVPHVHVGVDEPGRHEPADCFCRSHTAASGANPGSPSASR